VEKKGRLVYYFTMISSSSSLLRFSGKSLVFFFFFIKYILEGGYFNFESSRRVFFMCRKEMNEMCAFGLPLTTTNRHTHTHTRKQASKHKSRSEKSPANRNEILNEKAAGSKRALLVSVRNVQKSSRISL
jgi:hypothetical protein